MKHPRNKEFKSAARYKHVMQKLLTTYPNCDFPIFLLGYAPDTLRCRFRDAVTGMIKYRHEIGIDIDTLEKYWPQIEVIILNNEARVVMKNREKVENFYTPSVYFRPMVEMREPSPNLLCAALLLQRKEVIGEIKVFDLLPMSVEEIEKLNPNSIVVNDGDVCRIF